MPYEVSLVHEHHNHEAIQDIVYPWFEVVFFPSPQFKYISEAVHVHEAVTT